MTKDIGVVVLLKPLLGIKLKRLLQVSENMLSNRKESFDVLGFSYKINKGICKLYIEINSTNRQNSPEKKEIFEIFSLLVETIKQIHDDFVLKTKSDFCSGVCVGNIDLAEQLVNVLVSSNRKKKKILVENETFSFINDDMINIETNDNEMEKSSDLKILLSPIELKKIINKDSDNVHYIDYSLLNDNLEE